ncbi:MAG: M48 family metallopeptidase, partial [Kofleriaceae bacterium]
FQILDDPDPQAHAGLSRTVSVQRGALAYLRSEAELAAVLGHEIGHVLGGHAREVLRDARDDVGRSTTSASQRNRADLDDEIQADELAVVLVARAGYDPRAVETTMRALAATQPDVVFEPGDRHPPWRERIARIQAIAARLPPGELGVEAYRAGLATLVAGVDPRVASVVDRAAVFALAGVAVDLPPHRAAQVEDHRIEIDLADGSAAELRLLDPAVADFYPTEAKPEDRDVSVAIYRAARHALLITVAGPRSADHVRALRAAIRPIRPAERARTTPVLVDLAAPRALWSP